MSKDGGLVFPTVDRIASSPDDAIGKLYWVHSVGGMSLRQWFAGQALAGLAHAGLSYEQAAREAWAYADAMLAEGSGDDPPQD